MTECACPGGYDGYDGYIPASWVFTPADPENPGIVLGEINDGVTSFYILFLRKLKTKGRFDMPPRHDWIVLPAHLYDSPEKARAARKGG